MHRAWIYLYVVVLSASICVAYSTYNIITEANAQLPSKVGIQCIGQTCTIDIGESVGDPTEYTNVVTLLQSLPSNYTVVFKLHGYGGQVDGATAIMSAIERTKAHVEGDVTGSIYSCHAVLACAMPKIKWSSFGVVMFHSGSNTNEEFNRCANVKGTDRGLDARTKCMLDLKAESEIRNTYMYRYMSKMLTSEEMSKIAAGYEVFLNSEEAEKRLTKENK